MPKGKQYRNPKKSAIHEEEEFDQEIIDIARVTRVMAGGKRMHFRACVVIGDKKGRVGVTIAKGADVTIAINKAVTKAKKNIIRVNIVNDSIPCKKLIKFKAAKILLKPAPKGTGVKAGGSVRQVLKLAGIGNVTAKILGSNSKINNAFATIAALKELKDVEVPEKRDTGEKNQADEKKGTEEKSQS